MSYDGIKKVITNSRLLILAGTAYFLFSFIFTQLTSTNPNPYYDNSSNSPIGVLTGLFLYDGLGNVLSFVTSIVLFAISSVRYTKLTIRTRASFSIAALFLIGFLANIYWVTRYPTLSTYGQSGAMFALNGIVLIFCVFNIGPLFEDLKNGISNLKGKSKRNFFASSMSLVMAIFILYYVVFLKPAFLNEAPGVAFPVHAFSFLLGVVITVFFDLYLTARKGKEADVDSLITH